ncbi:MAG: hypothetical protein ACRCWS_01325, partial [Propionibacteriaceae bacterium]
MTRDESGLSESLQIALLLPLIIVVLLSAVGVGLHAQARTGVREAATAVAQVRAIGRSESDARHAGQQVAASADLRDVQISLQQHGPDLSVTIWAVAPSF